MKWVNPLSIVALCYSIIGCGNTTATKLGGGYEEIARTRQNLSEPSSSQSSLQYRTSNGKLVMIWPSLLSNVVVTNGLAVFVGSRTVDRSRLDGAWQASPRLFAVKAAELPLDITPEVLERWATKSGRDVAKALMDPSPLAPEITPDGISVSFGFNVQNWPTENIHLSLAELSSVMGTVRSKGTNYKDPLLGTIYVGAQTATRGPK
jgi:hypothetical protein